MSLEIKSSNLIGRLKVASGSKLTLKGRG